MSAMLGVPVDREAPAEVPALEAIDISKSFRTGGSWVRWGAARGSGVVNAVDRVSLQLHRGRVTALIGESGCGKSTVARLLSQLERPTSGVIALDGEPVQAVGGRRFRDYCSRVQLVLQDPFSSLNAGHTVGYHLERPLRIHRQRLAHRPASLQDRVCGLLEQVNLTPGHSFIGRYPHELSGGQRQRVAIARALASEPAILLADEPISMLDVSVRQGVLALLNRIRAEANLGILYITHDIASAGHFADEAMVMYAGEIIERGPARALTAKPAHPYTQLLIASAPDPARIDRPPLGDVGEPPNPARQPPGCRFHPRCPHAQDICKREAPPEVSVGPLHSARCWLFTG